MLFYQNFSFNWSFMMIFSGKTGQNTQNTFPLFVWLIFDHVIFAIFMVSFEIKKIEDVSFLVVTVTN